MLKVPKCEIFDRSDFDDFYTINSLCEGDFGVKIKNLMKIFWGFIKGCKVPYAYASGTDAQAEHMRKALVRMLSIRVKN